MSAGDYGVPFTADDVGVYLPAVDRPESDDAVYGSDFVLVKSVTAVDPHTVRAIKSPLPRP